jgi:hypothetical protein
MTETERELKDKVAEMVNLMGQYSKPERTALLLNTISNVFMAGKESGRQEARQDRVTKEAVV